VHPPAARRGRSFSTVFPSALPAGSWVEKKGIRLMGGWDLQPEPTASGFATPVSVFLKAVQQLESI